ncbi:ADP-ribosyl-[dinitrogen reductase] glycohydrolase [Gemmata sp. SH-PL17]|uniref:ADP-ribosylglycohydrolase family protein n=1 Tax=Gemmata sp. SH-PL17 TaxID=1630693 RepID=UPI00078E0BD9|nr:ADP-ribosylglycohydrolase family protein [Gemmata sp. SH-PL17]AMV28780.1 ADP-ribosyl-[dinitrogen reductase] glycohydrolase [Gemmata sp. SH-PL17]
MNETIRDRFRGCLIGLACGDAVGATVEFKSREHCRENPVTDMVGGGYWRLKPGQWTDDTSMAFAMGASIVRRGGFDPRDVMSAWIDWRQGREWGPSDGRGCFDIGGTTAAALARFANTGDPFAGSAAPHTAANGCLMRLAPVPLYALNMDRETRYNLAVDSARMTHAEPRCLDATVYLAETIRRLILFTPGAPFSWGFGCATPQLREMLEREAWGDRDDGRIDSGGYVLDTLEAAMWAMHEARDFRSAILRAVNLGGDADTTGAVAGQLAGAWWGYEGIPQEWRAKLDRHDELLAVADGMFDLAAKVATAA